MTRLHDLWRRTRRATRGLTPDTELLDRFVRHGDQAAFAELVDRLGPLVYGACRRLLPNPADVEDAFQASFLVLVRRADTLAGRPVGPWLHRVALWTARNFRRRKATASTRPLDETTLPGTPSGLDAADARLDIDAALSALPEKYRAPVILCHLQGWTRRELAAHLDCPESTASSLVGRGMAKLRKRLAGRDPAILLAVAGAATVPPGVAAAAVRAANLYRTNSLQASAAVAVAELTEGVLRMFRMKKWLTGLAVAVAVVGFGFGLTVGTGQRVEAQVTNPARQNPPADNPEREKLEKEIAAAKERVKQLEAQKLQLQLLKRFGEVLATEKKTPIEPHIGVWVRPPGTAGAAATEMLALRLTHGAIGGHRSEFAINEFGAPGQPVVEAHFYDVRSLQTYLTRAAKDPAAPKKVKLHIDKAYEWAKAKTVIDACKAAGFATVELASAPANPAASFAIGAPDVLRIEVTLKDGDKSVPLPHQPVTGEFLVRPDGTVSLGAYGSVKVDGLRPPAAADAIRSHLARVLVVRGDSVNVSLDVVAHNSKRYYVIVSGPERKEEAFAFPCTGNETVIDAFAAVSALAGVVPKASQHIVRKRLDGEPDQILPIDWAGITQHGETRTNYQILPDDRVYVGTKE